MYVVYDSNMEYLGYNVNGVVPNYLISLGDKRFQLIYNYKIRIRNRNTLYIFSYKGNTYNLHLIPEYLYCLKCNSEKIASLTQHHVFPTNYSRYSIYQDDRKTVILCRDCHDKYEKLAEPLKEKLRHKAKKINYNKMKIMWVKHFLKWLDNEQYKIKF